ncbi:hypothetical protein PG987_003919 [Apiospora arundinis]
MEDNQSNGVSEEDQPSVMFTDAIRPPPFPLNLESTWLLATVWVLLGATNVYVQSGLESILGLGPILLKALVTALSAVASAYFYDGKLALVNEKRIWMNLDVELMIASLVARHWRILIDEDATLEDQKEALMQNDTLQVPRTVFAVASELATWAVDCALVLIYHVSFWHVLSGLIWMLRVFVGLPSVLINTAILVGLLVGGRWLADTNIGRILRLWDICDIIQSLIASCLRGPLALLGLQLSPETIKQLTILAICAVLTATSWALPTDIMPFTEQDVDKLAGLANTLESIIYEKWGSLFSPKFDGSWASVGKLGAQVGLQLSLAAVFFVFVLVYHYLWQQELICSRGQVERGEIDFRYVAEDERARAAAWRTAALHIISFTAYQVAGMIVSAFELEPLLNSTASVTSLRDVRSIREYCIKTAYWLRIHGLSSLGTGLGIYTIHWILRQLTWLLVRALAWTATFEDAVAWYSRFTKGAIVNLKHDRLYLAGLDFKLKDKVLLAQGLMNFLFDIKAPLVIAPPNYSIQAFDPEVWAVPI